MGRADGSASDRADRADRSGPDWPRCVIIDASVARLRAKQQIRPDPPLRPDGPVRGASGPQVEPARRHPPGEPHGPRRRDRPHQPRRSPSIRPATADRGRYGDDPLAQGRRPDRQGQVTDPSRAATPASSRGVAGGPGFPAGTNLVRRLIAAILGGDRAGRGIRPGSALPEEPEHQDEGAVEAPSVRTVWRGNQTRPASPLSSGGPIRACHCFRALCRCGLASRAIVGPRGVGTVGTAEDAVSLRCQACCVRPTSTPTP